jgi:WD40 repeat protein
VISLLFSPVAEKALLAAGYGNGELVVFDSIEHKVQARTDANAHSIVSSPDGMLLACGNSAGMILIYEFESLKLVYRIISEEHSIKSLVFSANNQRLIDIRGPYCRVWDPPALLGDDLENNTNTASILTTPQDYILHDFDPAMVISTFVCCEDENIVICGKNDGSICLFDGNTGKMEQELVHGTCNNAITCLCYDPTSRILTSAGIDSSVVSYQLSWEQKTCRAERYLNVGKAWQSLNSLRTMAALDF